MKVDSGGRYAYVGQGGSVPSSEFSVNVKLLSKLSTLKSYLAKDFFVPVVCEFLITSTKAKVWEYGESWLL